MAVESSATVLTLDQRAVVEATTGAHVLVLAGAGTGKTHVLVERLAHLLSRDDGVAASEILVLSFTRAAVREIKDRVRSRGGDVARVGARTFDAYATRLLDRLEPDGLWRGRSYDKRIEYLLDLDWGDEVADVEHLMVDEIQDLVGVRAELVRRILLEAKCGFTLLGDVAQGIYDFQIEGDRTGRDFPALLAWVRSTFAESLEVCALAKNHRAATRLTRAVWEVWPQLIEPQPKFDRVHIELASIVQSGDRIGNLRLLRSYANDASASTAVLCYSNGTAYLVSRELHQLGIPHVLQRSGQDRVVDPWLARLMRQCGDVNLGINEFTSLYAEVAQAGNPEPDDAWRALRRAAPSGPRQIDVVHLVDKLRIGLAPDELCHIPQSPLVVSTVHRSKGREFDRVVVLDEVLELPERSELAAATKILFVAATRPRSDLFTAPSPDHRLRRGRSGRWIAVDATRKMCRGVELKSQDLHREDPPGAWRVQDDPVAIQTYIEQRVKPGDSLALERVTQERTGGRPATYRLVHDQQVVGVTNEEFSQVLRSELNSKDPRWPVRIDQLFVDDVETVAGTRAATVNAGVGECGLFLGVKPVGLGVLHWEAK